ncbi:PREDICTED: transmembrane protein 168 [Cyprinodon variegatus]|uniref:Transmembrane protein 168b n=1 Tax=Cyprinodon variegatus TaxID=28743 RepID=A0A3Q2G2C8_CYPVA|nr:PREDICTED: transmembrane protein 168 [Cyprinodon variegatus]XP_015259497.1 PREDICTED: transmembrane protein 168 [Cyprinodon variegatus]
MLRSLQAALLLLQEEQREEQRGARSSLRWLGYLSGLNLLLGVCLGLYDRRGESAVLAVFIAGLLVLTAAAFLLCFLRAERLCRALLHLCTGFLLGVLSFPEARARGGERAADYLLLCGAVLRGLRALLERLLGAGRPRASFLTSAERLQLIGFAASSAALLGQEALSVTLLLAALAAVMVTLRTKALLALPCLACFLGVSAGMEALSTTSPSALSCFFIQIICDPLLDSYFSGLSVTERWRSFLVSSGLKRRLALLPLLGVEVTFLALASISFISSISRSERRYLLVLVFALCAPLWAACHAVLLITVWGFHNKLSDCQRLSWTQSPEDSSLEKIMASKGMRHFCLISVRLVTLSLISTAALALLSWQESSGIFMSLVLLLLPLESLLHGLFYELGSSLGGTCVGYAVVIPTNFCSPEGQPLLLPPDQVSELNERSTGMLKSVQRFFAHHLIENFGCDYSTSGMSLDALQAKIRSFLELRTPDGPRHDTYVIFYSGHTHRSGEWAMAGGDVLRLDQLLEWWREKNGAFCSRLIIVLDCENSLPWVKEVRRVEGLYAAVQGASLARVADVEKRERPQLGDFTAQWVDYNCNPNSSVRWSHRGGAVSAAYGVSKDWSDYTLHLPTGSDVTNHWRMYFPRLTYPVVQLALWCGGLNLLWICSACLRFLRRIKMNWFPPAVLDTEQGFKLVRSN